MQLDGNVPNEPGWTYARASVGGLAAGLMAAQAGHT